MRKTRTHQEELKDDANLRRLAVVVRDSNDAVTMQDFTGRILAWNLGAVRMYGYTEKEALGMNALDLVPEESREENRRMLASLDHGEPITSFETRRMTKDGRVLDVWFVISLTMSPLPDEEGRIRIFSTTERDITERKRKEQDLIIANQELAFQNREKEKRAAELIIANKELALQNEEKEKRAAELKHSNEELTATVEVLRVSEEELDSQLEELQQSRDALTATKQLYHELFENVNVGILRTTPGPEGAFIDMNPAMVKLFEADSREQLMALHPSAIYWDASQRNIISNAIVAKGFAKEDVRFKTLKGKPLWCHINSVKKTDANGKVYFDSTIEDFTERKRVEEALASSEQFLNNVIEQSPVSLWISDSEGTLIKLNQSCRELFGATDEEVVGKYNLLKDNLIEEQGFIPLVENVFENGEIARFTIDYDLPRVEHVEVKEGTHRILDVVVSPIKDIHGELTNVLVQHKDITESKRAEEALRKSEERFSKVFQASPIGLSITRLVDGQYVDVNESFLSLFGYERAEALSHTSFQLQTWASPEERGRVVSILREQGRARNIEAQYRRKSGEIWTALVSAEVIEVAGEQYALGLLQDITERKRAEEALRTSEERFRTAAKSLTDVVYEWDLKEKLDWFGDIDGLMGYPAGEFPRTLDDWAKTVHPEDIKGVWIAVDGQLKGAKPYTTEYRIRKKDGNWLWWSARGTALRDEKGEPYKWIGAITDITESKRAEEALKESEIKFQNTVKYLDEGYYSCALDGLLLEHNQAFNQILGFDVTLNLKGEKLPDFWQNPEDRTIYLSELMTKGFIRNYLINAKTISGRKIVVMANSHLVKDDKDRIIRIDGTFTDFTEPKRIQDELERSNKELEQFAYVASHDLQEPLRMISSFTQLLARRYKDKLDAEANEFIDYAVDGANRMQRLINDLLIFSRVGSKGKPFAATDLNTIMGQVLVILNPIIEENHAIITNNELPTASVDESQMVQLFQNLIGNAIKFRSMEPPLIHVSVNENDREWTFGIKDNGIGIDLQYKERIFGVFQRLHSKEEYPGTGIGLAICKKIVERHGGRIWIESTPGKGSAFYFTLPKHNGQ